MFAATSGRTCKKWTDTDKKADTSSFPDGKNDHNYCRSVGARATPWCYTIDSGKAEDCDVPICESDGSSPIQGASDDATINYAVLSDSLATGSSTVATIHTELQEAARNSMKRLPKIFRNLGKLASSLGAMSSVIALFIAFIPEGPTPEFLAIQNGFSVMEDKIASLDSKLADATNLIVYTSKVQTYEDDAKLILNADKVFKETGVAMLAVSCKEADECKWRRADILLNVKAKLDVRRPLTSIINGLVSGTVFGGSILDAHIKTFRCDLTKLTTFTGGVLNLAIKALNPMLLYNKLAGTRTTQEVLDEWKTLVFSLRTKFEDLKEKCMANIDKYILEDVQDREYMDGNKDNEKVGKTLSGVLTERYPWLDWSIMVVENVKSTEFLKATCQFKSTFTGDPAMKRVICVGVSERGSTFSKKAEISKAFKDTLAAKTSKSGGLMYGVRKKWHAGGVYDGIKEKTFFTSYASWIETWAIIAKDGTNPKVISATTDAWYYADELKTYYIDRDDDDEITENKYAVGLKIKSDGRKAMGTCSLTCSGNGKCTRLPYTSPKECSCSGSWTGTNCDKPYDTSNAVVLDKNLGDKFKDLKAASLIDVLRDLKLIKDELKLIKTMVAKSTSNKT